MTTPTPAFRTYSEKMSDGLVVVPRVSQYFASGRFPKTVEASLYRRDRERPSDGWFWPSTHPGWSPRALYFYLAEPGRLEGREWGLEGILSVNVGTMAHELFKAALIDEGLLVAPEGEHCPSCKKPRKGKGRLGIERCNEHGVSDAETMTRGHLDGVLIDTRYGVGGYDLKTTNSMTIASLNDNDIEYFRKKWPYYYDQAQEYMRLSGLRYFIVHFVALGFPWTMKEVRIDFDAHRSMEIENKYKAVRAAYAEGKPPVECCTALGSPEKDCPARSICRSLR